MLPWLSRLSVALVGMQSTDQFHSYYADVAQSVVRRIGSAEVTGSIPVISLKNKAFRVLESLLQCHFSVTFGYWLNQYATSFLLHFMKQEKDAKHNKVTVRLLK